MLPVPKSSGLYLARGNSATCTAQGFFIQLGISSPFYNLSLAVYYVLVISYNWREERIKKYGVYMVGIPVVSGVALACAAIPFYGPSATMCYVEEFGEIFLVFPISVVILFATVLMIKIYLNVYHQERRVQRWIVRGGTDMSYRLSRKVFWRGFWYLVCFYVTWPVVIAIVFMEATLYTNFGLLCAVVFLTPLQGFLNFIAYSRLKFLWYLNKQPFWSCKTYQRHSTTMALEPAESREKPEDTAVPVASRTS